MLDLHIGAEVYWTDPDDGVCSGYYKVISIHYEDEIDGDTIVVINNAAGSEAEVFASELDEGRIRTQ